LPVPHDGPAVVPVSRREKQHSGFQVAYFISTRQSNSVNKAFILGAGLGTRLRPLTDHLPKPLVPLYHRPLAAWAMSSCVGAGIRHFAINTHHLAQAWSDFGNPPVTGQPAVTGVNGQPAIMRDWEGNEVALFHEPILLETGGGLKNIAAWIGRDPLLVHNGDIFSTLPLAKLIAAHKASGLPVTLALRSEGHAKHIALDASRSRVTDIRRRLGRADGSHVFSGIYCVNPDFLELLPAGEIVSVIPAFLTLAAKYQLGAVVLDEGAWLDLGDRQSYLLAHRQLSLGPAIHPHARIATGAIVENSIVGPGAVVASGAIVRDSILWAGSRISGDAVLDACIVCSKQSVSGFYQHADL
jgi:NDP-sugar pyrophosphorylase family protein